jgi:hypothetical protein
MGYKEPSFTIGVEEEYLLVDRETRDLVTDMPESMIEECEAAHGSARPGQPGVPARADRGGH